MHGELAEFQPGKLAPAARAHGWEQRQRAGPEAVVALFAIAASLDDDRVEVVVSWCVGGHQRRAVPQDTPSSAGNLRVSRYQGGFAGFVARAGMSASSAKLF